MPENADDPEYRARLQAKLEPESIRSTLAFAGLYQITHEMIKQAVLDEVRAFYCTGFDQHGWRYDEQSYRTQVLSKAKDKFRASLLWLVDREAITLAQADRLKAIYDHRHDLTHELVKYVVDPMFEPDVDLFIDALTILTAIRRFWTTVEKDIGTFGEDDHDIEEIVPLSMMILHECISAYIAGLPGQPVMPEP